MKIVKEMSLREIAGEHILIPMGQTAMEFSGLVNLNGSALLLWNRMQEECTEEDLRDLLLQEYEVDEETAMTDVRLFLDKLRREGILD